MHMLWNLQVKIDISSFFSIIHRHIITVITIDINFFSENVITWKQIIPLYVLFMYENHIAHFLCK